MTTVLLEATFPRALDRLVARFSAPEWHGARLEAWLFEDAAPRRAAEAALAESGVQARIRSAYKPLLHAFLEDGVPAGAILLPAHEAAAPGRFQLEAYPLAALLPSAPRFAVGPHALDHVLEDGSLVFAPNRIGMDAHGQTTLSPCGWLRVWRDTARVIDEALETEFESAFHAVIQAVKAHPWPATTPLFETLQIAIATGGIQRPLGVAHECVDTQEALHEDLYFSLLEFFQAHAGLPAGDRTLQPGQIVPRITRADGDTVVRVTIGPEAAHAAPLGPVDLETAERAPELAQVAAELAALGGTPFLARSVQGRPVGGLYRPGPTPALIVTAGQHANETSGPVGALRAARRLLADPATHLALVPVENVDGYQLHRTLCADHPHHMHHAARYTALGDDLEARAAPPWHESDARRQAIALTEARLHLSLHGYPAQEWTRPLSGYVSAGFADWTIPRGFFLILRHHPGLDAAAHRFLEQLTKILAEDADLVALNRAQMALRAAHGGAPDALVLHDIPCVIRESLRSTVPFTLITEYPDETITGPAFQLAHATQMRTVLAASRLLRTGILHSREAST